MKKNTVKKIIAIIMAASLCTVLMGCGGGSSEITVVSREDGSGTRSAFVELLKVEEKTADGNKTDKTTKEAIIANKTDVMLTNIAGDENAIGYVSLGSLNDTVKALKIDGVAPSAQTIKDKTYKLARPFNIVTKGETTGVAKDFINYILSREGQEIVGKSYVKVEDNAEAFKGEKPAGKIAVVGSSSVTPIMEKLKEGYAKVNPDAQVEVQMFDSTAGINGIKEGTCDIGMVSRDLKDTEKADVDATAIAIDGIAIIVNAKNPVSDMTAADIRAIYVGEKTQF